MIEKKIKKTNTVAVNRRKIKCRISDIINWYYLSLTFTWTVTTIVTYVKANWT